MWTKLYQLDTKFVRFFAELRIKLAPIQVWPSQLQFRTNLVLTWHQVGDNLIAIWASSFTAPCYFVKAPQGEDVIIKHLTCASCKPENRRGHNLKEEFSDTGMFGRLAASEVQQKPNRDKILFDEVTEIPEASYKDTSAFTHVFPDILDDIGFASRSH
jgi:hypothetical protein